MCVLFDSIPSVGFNSILLTCSVGVGDEAGVKHIFSTGDESGVENDVCM